MIPPIANNFVAGESEPEAIQHVDRINDRGVNGILNLLGEHYEERDQADEDTDVYCSLIEDIARADIDCCVSVKPSQIGLDVGDDVFQENIEQIVDSGADNGVFVWIDMEDHTTTDVTLNVYEELVRKYEGGVGVCVQANLKRTPADLERLAPLPGKVRLVKGAYAEPAEIAYRDRERVNQAYEECLEQLFESFDGGIAVGSHDPKMITLAKNLHDEYGTAFEIQMLMGVREQAQFEMADEYDVWQYIPYGNRWLSYFYRRIRERKENIVFAARAVLSGS